MNRIFTFFLFVPLTLAAQDWSQLSDFPGAGRDDGVSFTIQEKAYCGTGRDAGFAYRSDFYSFDLSTEQWTTIASMPAGNERQYAMAFSDGTYGYVCGGTNGDYFNDLWRYDPNANSWTELTALPASGRSGGVAFVIGQTAYIAGGRNENNDALEEVWAYEMATDEWTQLSDMPFGGRWRSSGTTQNQLGYLCFGWDEDVVFRSELYEYNPTIDQWSELPVFPGQGRTHVAMNAFDNKLIVFGGWDQQQITYDDLWAFNLLEFNWQQLPSIPASERRGGMSFAHNDIFYYTTGINTAAERLVETWKYTFSTSVGSTNVSSGLKLFPNPVHSFLRVELDRVNAPVQLSAYCVNGKQVWQGTFSGKETMISVGELPAGLYFLEAISGNDKTVARFVKFP